MTDTVKAWIQDRRAARVPNSTLSVSDAHNNLPRALTALEQVLELHKANETGECPHCGHDFQGSAIEWPCETIQAIEGAINE